jgi:hypothetical protein
MIAIIARIRKEKSMRGDHLRDDSEMGSRDPRYTESPAKTDPILQTIFPLFPLIRTFATTS